MTEPVIYGIHQTPFGKCLVCLIKEEICYLSFIEDHEQALAHAQRYIVARLHYNEERTGSAIKALFYKNDQSLLCKYIFLKGTSFQQRVWQAVCSIPRGQTRSYQWLAQKIGNPLAIRATANALGHNVIAYVIPCHRVIKKSGDIHRYKWGVSRKKQILDWEQSVNVVDSFHKEL